MSTFDNSYVCNAVTVTADSPRTLYLRPNHRPNHMTTRNYTYECAIAVHNPYEIVILYDIVTEEVINSQ